MAKYLLLLLSLICMLAEVTFGQAGGHLKGVLRDSAASQVLSGATVTLMQAKDSSLVSYTRTNAAGAFSIQNIGFGAYRLLITHVGYQPVKRNFVINQYTQDLDLGLLNAYSNSTLLQEVIVNQEKAPVTIKNDTVEYNAGSFKTQPNAVVEDLLKKLPGIQVDKDGKVKANGQEVKKVLVDGKEFFGNDPKLATKNLPADAVDKVQVFDRKSDQSRFTGFDDGNSEKTINLTIRPERKNGLFGKATAGAGDKGLYQGNANLNSFSGNRQTSVIAMGDNTNQQGFSFVDLLNFSGGLPGAGGRGGGMQMDVGSTGVPVQGMGNSQEGITTTWAGGLNYNNEFDKKLDLQSNYFFSQLQNTKDAQSYQQWLSAANPFNTTKSSHTVSNSQNHRVNLTGDYTIDSSNSIRVVSSLNLQHSRIDAGSRYESITAAGNLLNDGLASSFNSGEGYSWNNSALFRHRFPKKGRTLSTTLSVNLANTYSEGGLRSRNNYYLPDSSLQRVDTINQVNSQFSNTQTAGLVLSYTEPFGRNNLLEIYYQLNGTFNKADKQTYDYDPASGKHSIYNHVLSNDFSGHYVYQRPGMNWRFQRNKYNFTAGFGLQHSALANDFHLATGDTGVSKSFFNLLPNARLEYKISGYRNLRFQYNTFVRPPSMTQLQPIADNSDPLNIKIGNPDLLQEYYHRLAAEYMSFDPYRHTNFMAGLDASLTNNRIVTADLLNDQGQRISRPLNVNGVYNVNGFLGWGFPFRKLKSKLNLNSNISRSHNISFLNGDKNNINSWMAAQEFSWAYSYKEIFDFTAGTQLTFNSVNYSLSAQPNLRYWDQHYTAEFNVYLPLGLSIATDMDYTTRNGLSGGYNVNALIWNAGLAKQFLKNKQAEIRLRAFDILGQNVGISRNSNQNYVEDLSYNVLTRYWMLSFTYNIRRFAGKNLSGPDSRKSNIQVIRQGPRQ